MAKVRIHSSSLREGKIEEHYARIAYRGYELEGYGDQSFERLHERGGFSFEELVHFAFVAGLGKRVPFGKELE